MTCKNNQIEKENIETTELSSQTQQTTSAKLHTHTYIQALMKKEQSKVSRAGDSLCKNSKDNTYTNISHSSSSPAIVANYYNTESTLYRLFEQRK